jgi:hypothetical protein
MYNAIHMAHGRTPAEGESVNNGDIEYPQQSHANPKVAMTIAAMLKPKAVPAVREK